MIGNDIFSEYHYDCCLQGDHPAMADGKLQSNRNSGVDLLKVVAIILIIISHVVQTLTQTNSYVPYDYFIDISHSTTDLAVLSLNILRYCGVLGNSMFLVCSAWFLIDSKQAKTKKITSMLADIWFISMICLVAFIAVSKGSLPATGILIRQFTPTLCANNWYLTCYLLLYAVHPWLNTVIHSLSRRQLLNGALVLFVFYIGITFFIAAFFYSVLLLWITEYFIIAYLKMYMPSACDDRKLNIKLIIISIAGHFSLIAITDLLRLQIPAFNNMLMYWVSNYNPFMILIAIASFNLARGIRVRHNSFSSLASISMLVYLIHDNMLVRTYFRPYVWSALYIHFGHSMILLQVILYAAVLGAVSFLLSWMHMGMLQKPLHVVSDWFFRKWEKCYRKCIDALIGMGGG